MDFEKRIKTFQDMLKQAAVDGALLFYSRDIFYYTGTAQPAHLLVTPDEYFLFVGSGFQRAMDEIGVDQSRVIEERHLEIVAETAMEMFKGHLLGTELDLMPVNQFRSLKTLFPECRWIDLSPAILAQRREKDPDELAMIRKTCEVQNHGHKAVLSHLRSGITELELSAAVENAHRLAGHEGIFFMRRPDFFMSRGPIGSGINLSRFSGVLLSVTGVGLSPAVPAGPSKKRVEPNDTVIVDIPTLVRGYHGDQTRTYCLGKAARVAKDLHEALQEISNGVIKWARPGIPCSELFHTAKNLAKTYGVEDAFLNFGNGKKSHMIGHGIGLECTEPPIISKFNGSPLQENDVMAVEMHMYREGVDVVKIEDMIHIGSQQNEILTKSPRILFEVSR